MKHLPLRLFFTLIAVLWACRSESVAAPDFSASELAGETPLVVEGDAVRFRLSLRNRGNESAEPVQVRLQWPATGYVTEVQGLDHLQMEHDDRRTSGSVPVAAGAEKIESITVLAPRDSGGQTLSLSAQLMSFGGTLTEHWVHGSVSVDTRPATGGFRLGGIRVTTAGALTLLWLLVTGAAVLLAGFIRRNDAGRFFGLRAGVIALTIALGFWLIFAAMAWRDWQILNRWPESTATIVGRRVDVQSVSSSQRRTTGSGVQTRSSQISKPEFALRYTVDGRETLSSGYDTGSSLRVGGGKRQLEKEFAAWTVGTQTPCWYDPANPLDVVIKRGFGGAYLFALLPLLPFFLGLAILRRAWRREP